MASRGRGLFSLYIYTENFRNLLVRNHWTDCNIIWQKCKFGNPLPRLFKPFGFVKKHGHQGAGLIFPIYLNRTLEKIFLSETTGPISLLLGKNIFFVSLYQDCSSNRDSSKNMAARGWSLFSLYIYIENLKRNLLFRNQWTGFNIKKGKRKVQGVPQLQTAALPRPQEEEETDKSKQAQTEQTYEKH